MPGSSSSAAGAAPCTRVIVTGIASRTDEETLRDFFAFCGEISALHLYTASGSSPAGAKEAIVRFESEAAANTACLLNNAVIDGANVRVELFPMPDEAAPRSSASASGSAASSSARSTARSGGSSSSLSSIWNNISTTSLALASTVATKVKQVDAQYGVSEKVTTGASAAWQHSKKVAADIDEKYKVQEKAAAAASKAKSAASSAASSVTEQIAKARAKDAAS